MKENHMKFALSQMMSDLGIDRASNASVSLARDNSGSLNESFAFSMSERL
jgi:hypothetical protein